MSNRAVLSSRMCLRAVSLYENVTDGMTLRLLVLSLIVWAVGCVSYQPHAWTRSQARAPTAEQLPAGKLSGVRITEIAAAVRLLEDVEYVPLDDAAVKRFAKNEIHKSPGEIVFLVRGVSWSAPPLFREIYFDTETRTLYVDSYTYNGEIFIPGKRLSLASPIIVCLGFSPVAIVPNATIGGDRIVARFVRREGWREE